MLSDCQIWYLALELAVIRTYWWYLPALLYNKLFSNHSNKAFDAFSKDAIITLMSPAITYGIL